MVAEHLSSLDLSFLCLEGPTTPMHLGAVLIFAAPATSTSEESAERLATVLRHRTAAVPRLRRRLTSLAFPPGAAAWVDDPDFDPGDHVHCSTLPTQGGRAELANLVATLLARPLDRARPLWEMHVISGLIDGGLAVLVKIHHALADGLRAVLLGMAVFDNPLPAASRRSAATDQAHESGLLAGVVSTASVLIGSGRRLIDPRTSPELLLHGARQTRAAASVTVSLTHRLLRPAPRSH